MSLRDLLQRRQAATDPPTPRSPLPQGTENPLGNQQGSSGSPNSLANPQGRVQQEVEHAANDPEPPAPEADIDLLLENLRFDFSGSPLHNIDDELAGAIRQTMLPMNKRARAELAIQIDNQLGIEGQERLMTLLNEHNESQPQRQTNSSPLARR